MPEKNSDNLTTKIELLLATDGWPRVRAELARLGASAVPILIDKIRQGQLERKFRERAVLALGEIGGAEAELFLGSLLDDQDPVIRAAALVALNQIGSARHTPAIARLLNDIDDAVCKEAIRTLANLGDATSIEPLKALARSGKSEFLKELAQNAAEEIENRQA